MAISLATVAAGLSGSPVVLAATAEESSLPFSSSLLTIAKFVRPPPPTSPAFVRRVYSGRRRRALLFFPPEVWRGEQAIYFIGGGQSRPSSLGGPPPPPGISGASSSRSPMLELDRVVHCSVVKPTITLCLGDDRTLSTTSDYGSVRECPSYEQQQLWRHIL